jgi:hypothetical protein
MNRGACQLLHPSIMQREPIHSTPGVNVSFERIIWFDQLPFDLLIHVLSCLTAKDIIAARQVCNREVHSIILEYSNIMFQTCRALCQASRQPIVWMTALRRMCSDHDLFVPSFPIDTGMSLSQLEHVATSPERFLSCLRHNLPGGSIEPLKTRTLDITMDPSVPVELARLVPGGRYLFTLSAKTVKLWDIGFHANMPMNKVPIASMLDIIFPTSHVFRAIQPTADGLGFQMVFPVSVQGINGVL